MKTITPPATTTALETVLDALGSLPHSERLSVATTALSLTAIDADLNRDEALDLVADALDSAAGIPAAERVGT